MITISDVSKEFHVYKKRSGLIRQIFGLARPGIDFDTVKSLTDINLEIPSGSVHGIIGMNGAGKSTLLKILTGVLEPSSGKIEMKGRVAALLELGTGFHGELTGRQNVYTNAAIMGLTRAEVDARINEIEDFAELGNFFDRPLKIYSSGMYVRLAFSFAVSVDPDILIIDEALSVGDAYFQQKCLKKIHSFRDKGTTILFVSHDFGAIKMLCQQVTLLSKGQAIFSGAPMQALDLYNALLADHHSAHLGSARVRAAGAIDAGRSHESGSRTMEILEVQIVDAQGRSSEALVSGSSCKVLVRARVNGDEVINPTCGILVRDRLGYDVFGTNTFELRIPAQTFNRGELVEFRFEMAMNLGAGDYTLTVALHSDRTHVNDNYHWLDRAQLFQVLPSNDFGFIGVSRLEPRCTITLI